MLPAASSAGVVVKPSQPVTAQTATRTTQPQAPETARASAGEAAAANVRTETPGAIQAAEQSAVSPRLRDQETAERTERKTPSNDAPTGPEPTFEESPLERQARVALDPAEVRAPPEEAPQQTPDIADTPDDIERPIPEAADAPGDPPPTPSERAEVSFAETREISEHKEPVSVDLAR